MSYNNPRDYILKEVRDKDCPYSTKMHTIMGTLSQCEITGQVCNLELGEPCKIYQEYLKELELANV